MAAAQQVIVIGGGLSGLSAAMTVLERGANVVLLDKCAFLGGNSTKATSGINGAGTSVQRANNVPDSAEAFYNDTAKSAGEGLRPELVKTLTYQSGPAVEWLIDSFGIDLSILGLMGAASHPRVHRGKEKFPGAMITMTLMEHLEAACDKTPDRARVITKANCQRLVTDASGAVVGVEYSKDGATHTEMGPVILCTGGFGADFSDTSLLQEVEAEWRGLKAWDPVKKLPALRSLPTTNGEHCTGDGIKMGLALNANTVDMEAVQVHPTGLVDPRDPDSKVRFLAAEALRGAGGVLIDRNGKRFANELGKRDYVSGRMWNSEGPFRLCLNSKAAATINWHCKHYASRGLMKHYKSGKDLEKEMGLPAGRLTETFSTYSKQGASKSCPFGKQIFNALPVEASDEFYVAIVGPVVHYCMGGIEGDGRGQVVTKTGTKIDGLFCGGEVMGGVHGKNRLGGSSLLDCVVFGRVSGGSAAECLMARNLAAMKNGTIGAAGGAPGSLNIEVTPSGSNGVNLKLAWGGAGGAPASISTTAGASAAAAPAAAPAAADAAPAGLPLMTMEEVAKHTTKDDCWVVIRDEVYDITDFLEDHPGGVKAPLLYAGKDATEEFDMLHKPELLDKYAAEYKIGRVAPAGGVAPAAAAAEDDLPVFTIAEVSQHNTEKDCWLIINDLVYDVSDFLSEHPGGRKAPLMYGGKDATEEFDMLHSGSVIKKYGKRLLKGRLAKAKL